LVPQDFQEHVGKAVGGVRGKALRVREVRDGKKSPVNVRAAIDQECPRFLLSHKKSMPQQRAKGQREETTCPLHFLQKLEVSFAIFPTRVLYFLRYAMT
jgi:hypothetical protein